MTFKRKKLTLFIILVAPLCLCACSKNDPEKMTKESMKALSWIASAELIFESWSHGAVPDAYAQRSLDRINEELGRNLERLQLIPDNRSAQVIPNIQQVQGVVSQLSLAVEHGDRSGGTQFQTQLADRKRMLTSTVNGAPQTP
jgi:hypothetical protein